MKRRIYSLILIFSFVVLCLPAYAQYGGGDVYGSWTINITVTDATQWNMASPGPLLPTTLTETLILDSGKVVREWTVGDSIIGFVSSPGFGNWTYLYNAAKEGGVKLVSMVSRDGILFGTKTTLLRLKPNADNSQLTGSYKATLIDTSGNVVYQVSGTLTGTPLKVNIDDDLICTTTVPFECQMK